MLKIKEFCDSCKKQVAEKSKKDFLWDLHIYSRSYDICNKCVLNKLGIKV